MNFTKMWNYKNTDWQICEENNSSLMCLYEYFLNWNSVKSVDPQISQV